MDFNEHDIFGMYSKLIQEGNNEINKRKGFAPDLSHDDDAESFFSEEEKYNIEHPGEKNKVPDSLIERVNPVTGDIEETAVFKRYRPATQRKFTETEIAQIREECRYIIVHDFSENDQYHISDEERAKNDILVEISMKLAGVKSAYRKVDQFIEAMRIVYRAWEIMARRFNMLYSEEEILQRVAEGRIVSDRIPAPKLKGIKKYNLEKIAEYIQNHDLDPKDLVVNKDDDEIFYMDDEFEEEAERILSDEEKEFIASFDPKTTEKLEVKLLPNKYVPTNNQGKNKKNYKKLKKSERKVYDSYDGMFSAITMKEVTSYNYFNTFFTEPKTKDLGMYESFGYQNSWADDTAAEIYEMTLDQELLDQKAKNEKYLTNRDVMLTEFFRTMESHGMSVKQLRENMGASATSNGAKEMRLNRKKNKIVTQSIIDRIVSLNNDPKFKKKVKRIESKLTDEENNK